MSIALNAANFLLFQIVWFATVIGAANNLIWPGLAAMTVFIIVHAVLTPNPGRDYCLCALAIVIGVIVESANAATGLIDFGDSLIGGVLPPLWILILWCNLGLILNHSIVWLQQQLLLAALLGALGGAMSYAGGVALGAAEFGRPAPAAIGAIALTWAIVTPLLMISARRLNRVSRLTPAA